MNPPKNEILGKYLSQNEIKELQEKNSDKFKNLKEKLSKLGVDTKLELQNLKHELDNLTLDEKVDKLLGFIEEAEKNQKPTKSQEQKAKKEAEEKGFSWDKITKIVEEKGGWFTWAGFTAGISAFFSDFLGNLFNKVKKKVEDLATQTIGSLTNKTPGTFDKNEYFSYKKSLDIKFNKDNTVKQILINNEKYVIPNGYKLKVIEGERCLVGGGKLSNNVFALDYLGKYFDDFSENKDKYKIDENTNNLFDNFKPGFFKGDITFQKESLKEKTNENILEGKNIKVFCNEKIIENQNSQKIKIEKLEIYGNIYELYFEGNKNLEFELISKNDGYYLDFGASTGELKINDIPSLVSKKGYKLDDESFSLYKLIDNNGKILDNLNLIVEAIKTGDWKKYKFGKTIIALKK